MNEQSSRSENPLGYGPTGLPHVKRLINIGPGVFLVQSADHWYMHKNRRVYPVDQPLDDGNLPLQEDLDELKTDRKSYTVEEILKLRDWQDIKSRETIYGITKVCLYFSKKKKVGK